MNYSDLPVSCMAFKLADGNVLFINKEDVHSIAMKIIVEGSLMKNTVILKEEDNTLKKVDVLCKILKEEKDMNEDTRDFYLRQIATMLLSVEKQLSEIGDKMK